MSPPTSPSPPPPASALDPSLYDCARLFPLQYEQKGVAGALKLSPVERSLWTRISAVTVGAVGLMSKFWLTGANSAAVYHRERLTECLDSRPEDTPLITVANHHSCMDEPLMWGMLRPRHLINSNLMRWALAAHDICFTNIAHAKFFAYGKSVPVVRGGGVFQQGMDFILDRLNEGKWVHIYPEGKVNTDPKIDLRLKWGVGRLISECKVLPIVIPIYHLGFDSILPNVKPYIPRVGQKVTIVVGEPIDFNPVIRELEKAGADAEQRRKALTDLVQQKLRALRKETEIMHAKHTYTGN